MKQLKHILLIKMDSLKRDRLGFYGYSLKNISTQIDHLSKQSIVFNQAIINVLYAIAFFKTTITSIHPFNYR